MAELPYNPFTSFYIFKSKWLTVSLFTLQQRIVVEQYYRTAAYTSRICYWGLLDLCSIMKNTVSQDCPFLSYKTSKLFLNLQFFPPLPDAIYNIQNLCLKIYSLISNLNVCLFFVSLFVVMAVELWVLGFVRARRTFFKSWIFRFVDDLAESTCKQLFKFSAISILFIF